MMTTDPDDRGLDPAAEQSVINAVRLSAETPASNLPDDMWDRIERDIITAPPLPLWQRYALPLAAALLVLALGTGFFLGRITSPDGDSYHDVPVRMRDNQIAPTGTLSYDQDRKLFVLDTAAIPSAPDDMVYQVWLEDESGTTSAGVIDPNNPAFAFFADRHDISRMFISQEPAPAGSDSPTTSPMGEAILDD